MEEKERYYSFILSLTPHETKNYKKYILSEFASTPKG
jgi:hypothetical protein